MSEPAAYTWELGIDWNAVEANGSRFMRQGLVKNGEGMVEPSFQGGETIQFVIFDVSSNATSAQLSKIESFVIISRPAVIHQSIDNVLDRLQLTFGDPENQNVGGAIFTNPLCRLAASELVTVGSTVDPSEVNRFLLTFQVQAQGLEPGSSRLFVNDPEMEVGPNMISGSSRGGSETDQESVIAHVTA